MSAPVRPPQSQSQEQQQQQQQQSDSSSVPTDTPFWYNPCGMTYDGSGGGGGGMTMETDSMMRRPETEIITSILVYANEALNQVLQFAESFVNKTFKVHIKQLHEQFKDSLLTWVDQAKYMPKELGVPLDKSYLDALTLKELLHAIYIGLQNLAVGLEQVAWDQRREGLPFYEHFNNTTFRLKAILCEVSNAIYEMNDTPDPYVSRDIMTEKSRTALRDWLILRDYITGLEYVIDTLKHLKERIDDQR